MVTNKEVHLFTLSSLISLRITHAASMRSLARRSPPVPPRGSPGSLDIRCRIRGVVVFPLVDVRVVVVLRLDGALKVAEVVVEGLERGTLRGILVPAQQHDLKIKGDIFQLVDRGTLSGVSQIEGYLHYRSCPSVSPLESCYTPAWGV